MGIHLISKGIIGQAQDKARTDLNSARYLYHAEIKRVNNIIRLTAQRFFIKDALLKGNMETLKTL